MCEGSNERNVMILFLSNFFPKDTGEGVKTLDRRLEGTYEFHDGTMDNMACTLTNEAPIRDVVAFLKQRKKKLDKIVYFVTSALQDEPVKLLDGGQIREYKTKEELFLRRIRGKCSPDLDETEFIGVPFYDKSDQPMQECIKAVVRMENEIKRNLLPGAKDSNHLFADITGGMRIANMAMTAVIQLLQYEGIQIDLVLYSYSSGDIRRILDVRDVDDLYKLVAGVDAFTSYGRSDAIEKYFNFVFSTAGKETAPKNALERLLFTMHRCADAMSLCWPDYIESALKDLIKAINAFPSDSDDTREKMLIQLMPTIRNKYDSLLFQEGEKKGEVDRLAVIEWCINNNLIQQALTFCTEWLPQYIVDYGAVYTDDPAVQAYCKAQKKDGDRETNGKKYFIMDFFMNRPNIAQTSTDEQNGRKTKKSVLEKIAEATAQNEKNDLIDAQGVIEKVSWKVLDRKFVERLSSYLDSIPRRLRQIQNPQAFAQISHDQDSDIFSDTIEKIRHPNNAPAKPLMQITDKDVYEKMKKWSWSTIAEKFHAGIPKTYPYVEICGDFSEDDDASEKARKICFEMLNCNMMKTVLRKSDGTPNIERAAEYIQHYTNIRSNIRNTSLHAANTINTKKKVPQTFTEVKNELETCLDLMIELVRDERAKAHKTKNVWPDAPKKKEATQ